MMLGPYWSNVAHVVLEAMAYFVGGRLFFAERARTSDGLHDVHRRADGLWVLAGAVCGAALGSKVLVWLQHPHRLAEGLSSPIVLLAGKTIVGGLLGGWIGVEIAKRGIGLRRSTGDLFVLPLIAGMVVGRLGCLVAGVYDDTFGVATSLPWGLDLGDGVRRHPTALYEIVALLLVAPLLVRLRRAGLREGDTFRLFVAAYLAFRLGADGLKPPHGPPGVAHTAALPSEVPAALYGGTLTAIQLACLAGLAYTAPAIVRAGRARRADGSGGDGSGD